jgi:hypothetical protein
LSEDDEYEEDEGEEEEEDEEELRRQEYDEEMERLREEHEEEEENLRQEHEEEMERLQQEHEDEEEALRQEYESDCFVATACYGSALDEHIVFLRRFRDCEVMWTNVGRTFMRFFNAFYYSFSPSLASYLRHHQSVKLVVRYAAVTPIVHLLRFSCYLTNPINKVSREAGIVATGAAFLITWFIIGWVLLFLISQLLGFF